MKNFPLTSLLCFYSILFDLYYILSCFLLSCHSETKPQVSGNLIRKCLNSTTCVFPWCQFLTGLINLDAMIQRLQGPSKAMCVSFFLWRGPILRSRFSKISLYWSIESLEDETEWSFNLPEHLSNAWHSQVDRTDCWWKNSRKEVGRE